LQVIDLLQQGLSLAILKRLSAYNSLKNGDGV